MKKKLRLRGLSRRGLKAELIERLSKAYKDKVLLMNVVTTSIWPSGFDERTKWILLRPQKEAEEPKSLDTALVEHDRLRDQRTKADIADSERGTKKFDYSEKFNRDKHLSIGLQLIINKRKPKTTTKKGASKKKRGSTSTTKPAPRKYEMFPLKKLIPTINFVQKHHLNKFSNPTD